MSRTKVEDLLESANSVDILLYIGEHPLCQKSEIYANITRNAHTREKIDTLCEEGLLSIIPTGKANNSLLELTEKGHRVVELLSEIEDVLSPGFRRDCALRARLPIILILFLHSG